MDSSTGFEGSEGGSGSWRVGLCLLSAVGTVERGNDVEMGGLGLALALLFITWVAREPNLPCDLLADVSSFPLSGRCLFSADRTLVLSPPSFISFSFFSICHSGACSRVVLPWAECGGDVVAGATVEAAGGGVDFGGLGIPPWLDLPASIASRLGGSRRPPLHPLVGGYPWLFGFVTEQCFAQNPSGHVASRG